MKPYIIAMVLLWAMFLISQVSDISRGRPTQGTAGQRISVTLAYAALLAWGLVVLL